MRHENEKNRNRIDDARPDGVISKQEAAVAGFDEGVADGLAGCEASGERIAEGGSGYKGDEEKEDVEPPAPPGPRSVGAGHYCSVCSSFPGLKRTALPGGMATSAPVRGLRPIPVFLGRTLKIPKPRNSIRSPSLKAFFMFSKTVSTAISAFVFVMPVRLTTSLMISSLIKGPPGVSPPNHPE